MTRNGTVVKKRLINPATVCHEVASQPANSYGRNTIMDIPRTPNILEEALKITHGDRQRDYDSPERNFQHIAEIASAILKKKITPKEIAMIAIATKLAREQFRHKRDSCTDIAGYAWVLSRIEGDEAEEVRHTNGKSLADCKCESCGKHRKELSR